MKIPLILHQIGPTQEVPEYLKGFADSWSKWNPSIQRMYWTDYELRNFISDQAPEFLTIFDSFTHGVCRADLGRYLLLQHIGGIYADLDCQCLRPIAQLIEGKELVISAEPKDHLRQKNVQDRDLMQIICPSFIASVPNHALWHDVLSKIVNLNPHLITDTDDVLDYTGPFLLSKLFSENNSYNRYLVPAKKIYPFTKEDCWEGRIFDPIFWSEKTEECFVAHYWHGSWFRKSEQWRTGVPKEAPVHVKEPPAQLTRRNNYSRNIRVKQITPLISCLMVTSGRRHQVTMAIECFLAQTYPNRELIVVDDDPKSELDILIREIGSPNIRHVKLTYEKQSLGRLRNIALDNAHGMYICQWDDDDLYDPLRLEVQWQTLVNTDSQASVLARWIIWWPNIEKMAISGYRDWEGSLLCERSLMPRYPDLKQGEDSIVMEELRKSIRIARIDMPRLYVYINHGENTFSSSHFEEQWKLSTYFWQDGDTLRIEHELNRRIPILNYRKILEEISLDISKKNKLFRSKDSSELKDPKVLILTPIRDATQHLEKYISLLENINYNKEQLTLALLEGDSQDGTYSLLNKLRPRFEKRFKKVKLYRKHFYPAQPKGERWETSLQRERRERLAKTRNHLLMNALDDEDWVLWLDVDVCEYPADLIHQLIASGRDIVTANCLGATGSSFDLNSFRMKSSIELEVDGGTSSEYMKGTSKDEHYIDGLWQPPKGIGRNYVDAYKQYSIVELDAVGGTVLMIRAALHRQGLNFPTYPVGGFIETEGLSMVARKMGIRSWGLPQLIVHHV